MEIKDRLIKIIASEGLNSSAFADSIGVQRSSISHILSGRNKPSIDFLEKILSSYPKYCAEWLIMGTGEITKTPKQPSLFDIEPVIPTEVGLNALGSIQLIAANNSKNEENNQNNEDSSIYKTKTINYDENPLKDPVNTIPELHSHKAIERIVIFYTDHTFFDYVPGK